ncbi:MAG: hypothetical protein J6A89_07435 [Clostridia bacterium]|nr:hypothetical protein [Clostridia bacterium]
MPTKKDFRPLTKEEIKMLADTAADIASQLEEAASKTLPKKTNNFPSLKRKRQK